MSLPFDELVETFESSRGLPLPAQRGLVALVDDLAVGRKLKILDAGAGTGRLALPLLERGHDVVAVDLAPPMLAHLAGKLAASGPLIGVCRMVRADVVALPFTAHLFDAALVASVLYLVPDWRAVVAEVSRVLRPDGALLFVAERSESSPALERFDTRWRETIEATGYRHPSSSPDDAAVIAALDASATTCEVHELASWTAGQTVGQALDSYGARLRPLYATVPDDTWQVAVEDFTAWARTTFPDPATRFDFAVTVEVTVARGLTRG